MDPDDPATATRAYPAFFGVLGRDGRRLAAIGACCLVLLARRRPRPVSSSLVTGADRGPLFPHVGGRAALTGRRVAVDDPARRCMMAEPMVSRPPAVAVGPVHIGERYLFTGLAVAAIWIAAMLSSIFAPDFVSGSRQEHLQVAVWVNLMQAILATAFVLFGPALSTRTGAGDRPFWIAFASMIGVIWLASTAMSVFVGTLVTGTDPTRIPLAALTSPVFATIATAFVAIYTAGSGGSSSGG